MDLLRHRRAGGPHLKSGCPIFGAVLSRLRWAIVRSTILSRQTRVIVTGLGPSRSEIWVPHLRRGLIATKVGHRAKHDPLTSDTSDLDWSGFVVSVVAIG